MPLDDYLRRFADQHRITLVGPLLDAPRAAADCGESLRSEPIVWVDGGAAHRRGGIGFAVGDGDSARGRLDQYLRVDKDYSDLGYVLRRLPAHFDDIVLLGFLGARRDHELFNLGEVHHFLAAAPTPTRARFDQRILAYSRGEWRFEARALFSLAALAPTTVQLTGACKYPLPRPTELAALSSRGLSNEGFGAITLHARGPAFILFGGV